MVVRSGKHVCSGSRQSLMRGSHGQPSEFSNGIAMIFRSTLRWFVSIACVALPAMATGAQPLWITTTPVGTTPVVDGVMGEDEWQDAAVIHGAMHQVHQQIDGRDVTFMVKADGSHVYVAMRSAVRS